MKARKVMMLAMVMVLSVFVTAKASAATSNSVFNGDFEITSTGNDSGIEGWGNFTGVRDLVEVTNDAHSGSTALKIAQWDSEIYIAQFDSWVKDKITAYDPTKDAVLSVWVKYEGITGEGLMLLAERKYNGGADNAYVQTEPGTIVGTSDGWVKLELAIPAMGETELSEVGVGIKVLAGEGVVYIDDFSFTPADAAADTSTDASTDTSADTSNDTSADTSTDTSVAAPADDSPIAPVEDTSADIPKTGENTVPLAICMIGLVATGSLFIGIRSKVKR